MYVYMVGSLSAKNDGRWFWKLMGVYTCAPDADKACKTKNDFVRPVLANEPLPEVGTRPTDIYFPRRRK